MYRIDLLPPKTCVKCYVSLPRSSFCVSEQRSDGLKGWCRACSSTYGQQWNKSNPDKITEYAKTRWSTHKAHDTSKRLQRLYGVSLDDYLELIKEQGNCCAICGSADPGGRIENFHIDHCHDSGQFRGLLCMRCNTALGLFKDSPEVLLQAYEYLSRSVKVIDNV